MEFDPIDLRLHYITTATHFIPHVTSGDFCVILTYTEEPRSLKCTSKTNSYNKSLIYPDNTSSYLSQKFLTSKTFFPLKHFEIGKKGPILVSTGTLIVNVDNNFH